RRINKSYEAWVLFIDDESAPVYDVREHLALQAKQLAVVDSSEMRRDDDGVGCGERTRGTVVEIMQCKNDRDTAGPSSTANLVGQKIPAEIDYDIRLELTEHSFK